MLKQRVEAELLRRRETRIRTHWEKTRSRPAGLLPSPVAARALVEFEMLFASNIPRPLIQVQLETLADKLEILFGIDDEEEEV